MKYNLGNFFKKIMIAFSVKYKPGDLFVLKCSRPDKTGLILYKENQDDDCEETYYSNFMAFCFSGQPVVVLILESYIKHNTDAYRVLVSCSDNKHYHGYVFKNALVSAVESQENREESL